MTVVPKERRWRASLGAGVLAFAIAVYCLVCSAIAFTYHDTLDTQAPLGTQSGFTVTALPPTDAKADVASTFLSLAEQHHINIYKVSPDSEGSDRGRILFAFVGDPANYVGDPVTGQYPSFNTTFITKLRPYKDITTQDMRGLYAVNVGGQELAPLMRQLSSSGFDATLEDSPQAALLGYVLFGKSITGPLLVVTALGLLVSVAFYSSKRFAIFTVRYIHGQSRVRGAMAEAGRVAAFYGLLVGVCLAGNVLGLYWYNRLAQGAAYFSTLGLLLAIGMVVLLAGHALIFTAMIRWKPSEVIKGKTPLAHLALLSVLAQAVALGVCFPTISAGLLTLSDIARDSRLDNNWLAAKDFVTISISGTTNGDEFTALAPKFGSLVRAEEQKGRLVLADRPRTGPEGPAGYGPNTGSVLIVNNKYLSEQDVLSPSGQRIGPVSEGDGQIHLLVPTDVGPLPEATIEEYEEWALFQRSLDGKASSEAELTVDVVETAPNQEIFNYGAKSAGKEPTQLNPVIVVVPESSHILSSDFYQSAASRDSVFFTSASVIKEEIISAGLDKSISAINSISDRALAERNVRLADSRAQTMSISLFAAILVALSIVLARVYFERNRHRLFVEAVHGKAFSAMHAQFLMLTALMAFGLLAAEIVAGIVRTPLGIGICLAMASVLTVLTSFHLRNNQQTLLRKFARLA